MDYVTYRSHLYKTVLYNRFYIDKRFNGFYLKNLIFFAFRKGSKKIDEKIYKKSEKKFKKKVLNQCPKWCLRNLHVKFLIRLIIC